MKILLSEFKQIADIHLYRNLFFQEIDRLDLSLFSRDRSIRSWKIKEILFWTFRGL